LYEGSVRAHNLVRQLQGVLVSSVIPAASRYHARGDRERLAALVLRGTRYVVLVALPVIVTLIVCAKPLLTVWLGHRFAVAATALRILVSYWLVNVAFAVAVPALVAVGQARWLAVYAWVVAIISLALSLLLTWQLGLDGVVLGTTIPMVAMAPVLLGKTLRTLPVSLGDFVRQAWLPAYGAGAILAVGLIAIQTVVSLDRLAPLLAVFAGAPLCYWIGFYVLGATPGERALGRDLLRAGRARLGAPWRPPLA
jgi:O-antigen/teichoic acid export membrane protein